MVAVPCVRRSRYLGSSADSREYISLRRDVNQLIGFVLESTRQPTLHRNEAKRELPYLPGETPIQCRSLRSLWSRILPGMPRRHSPPRDHVPQLWGELEIDLP